MKKISLPILIIGIWLIVSPWILGFFQYNLAAWNAIIIGVILIIFSLVPVRRRKK
jgi:ABC-type transport system involved in cytochrome bd biosynthesis fused ATPase/permease subunit